MLLALRRAPVERHGYGVPDLDSDSYGERDIDDNAPGLLDSDSDDGDKSGHGIDSYDCSSPRAG